MANLDENFRELCLAYLDVAANQMAIRKLLYDAGIANEKTFQQAYAAVWESQLAVFQEIFETSDADRLRAILAGLDLLPQNWTS